VPLLYCCWHLAGDETTGLVVMMVECKDGYHAAMQRHLTHPSSRVTGGWPGGRGGCSSSTEQRRCSFHRLIPPIEQLQLNDMPLSHSTWADQVFHAMERRNKRPPTTYVLAAASSRPPVIGADVVIVLSAG
jgi:hypothetical protein